VTNPAINRRQQPGYLVIDALPWVAIPRLPSIGASKVFAIDGRGPDDRACRVYRWTGGAWVTVGSYWPRPAIRSGLSLPNRPDPSSIAIFESTNVVDTIRLSRAADGPDDDAVYASVRSVVGATAELLRVSDMIELDWLQQRIREAA
jgi:hypothetical protein